MQIKKLLSPAHFQQNLAQTSASEEQVSTFFSYWKLSTSSSSSVRFTHSIIVVVTISLWKTSLKCQGKLEEIVIAYHLKFHISYYSNTQKLPPLRDMTESRHMPQEQKLRWGWKICCNQNSSSSFFSDLKLSLSWGFMNIQKNQSFSVHWFSHLPWGETWLINLLFVLNIAETH